MGEKRESRKTRHIPRAPTAQETGQHTAIEQSVPLVEKAAAVHPMITPEMLPDWKPKTSVGKDVMNGKIRDMDQLFAEGTRITEAPIVDALLPGLENELILIGGSTGKGGGIRRITVKRTARMHRSGRRYRISVMVTVGNRNGYVGLGHVSGPPGRHRETIEKGMTRAKLNVIPIRRGCGSWECRCGSTHSIPFAVDGKAGSVRIRLMPAPKGVGLVTSDEVKKLLRLAGISDIWCKTRGQTQARTNLILATFDALKKLNRYRTTEESEKPVAMITGKAL
jgi:small subunit ribosomal protein S5